MASHDSNSTPIHSDFLWTLYTNGYDNETGEFNPPMPFSEIRDHVAPHITEFVEELIVQTLRRSGEEQYVIPTVQAMLSIPTDGLLQSLEDGAFFMLLHLQPRLEEHHDNPLSPNELRCYQALRLHLDAAEFPPGFQRSRFADRLHADPTVPLLPAEVRAMALRFLSRAQQQFSRFEMDRKQAIAREALGLAQRQRRTQETEEQRVIRFVNSFPEVIWKGLARTTGFVKFAEWSIARNI